MTEPTTPSREQIDEMIQRERSDRLAAAQAEVERICQEYNVVIVPRIVILGGQVTADVQILSRD